MTPTAQALFLLAHSVAHAGTVGGPMQLEQAALEADAVVLARATASEVEASARCANTATQRVTLEPTEVLRGAPLDEPITLVLEIPLPDGVAPAVRLDDPNDPESGGWFSTCEPLNAAISPGDELGALLHKRADGIYQPWSPKAGAVVFQDGTTSVPGGRRLPLTDDDGLPQDQAAWIQRLRDLADRDGSG